MNHRGADLYAGGEAIDDEASCFLFKDGQKVSGLGDFSIGAVNGGGELSFQFLGGGNHVIEAPAFDQKGRRTEDFLM